MRADAQGATPDQMRERIERARTTELRLPAREMPAARERIERARTAEQARGYVNSELPPRLLSRLCRLDDAGERTLELAMRKMGLPARAHDGILKVARTITDLDASEAVSAKHLAEAVQYRSPDRSYWSRGRGGPNGRARRLACGPAGAPAALIGFRSPGEGLPGRCGAAAR